MYDKLRRELEKGLANNFEKELAKGLSGYLFHKIYTESKDIDPSSKNKDEEINKIILKYLQSNILNKALEASEKEKARNAYLKTEEGIKERKENAFNKFKKRGADLDANYSNIYGGLKNGATLNPNISTKDIGKYPVEYSSFLASLDTPFYYDFAEVDFGKENNLDVIANNALFNEDFGEDSIGAPHMKYFDRPDSKYTSRKNISVSGKLPTILNKDTGSAYIYNDKNKEWLKIPRFAELK